MSKVLKRLVGTDGGGIKADLNAFTLARHGYFCPLHNRLLAAGAKCPPCEAGWRLTDPVESVNQPGNRRSA